MVEMVRDGRRARRRVIQEAIRPLSLQVLHLNGGTYLLDIESSERKRASQYNQHEQLHKSISSYLSIFATATATPQN